MLSTPLFAIWSIIASACFTSTPGCYCLAKKLGQVVVAFVKLARAVHKNRLHLRVPMRESSRRARLFKHAPVDRAQGPPVDPEKRAIVVEGELAGTFNHVRRQNCLVVFGVGHLKFGHDVEPRGGSACHQACIQIFGTGLNCLLADMVERNRAHRLHPRNFATAIPRAALFTRPACSLPPPARAIESSTWRHVSEGTNATLVFCRRNKRFVWRKSGTFARRRKPVDDGLCRQHLASILYGYIQQNVSRVSNDYQGVARERFEDWCHRCVLGTKPTILVAGSKRSCGHPGSSSVRDQQ